MKSLRSHLEKRDVEILGSVPVKEDYNQYRHILDKSDLIIVNGEGSIHDGKRMDLIEIATEYNNCVLINSVFQNVPKNYLHIPTSEALAKFKYISCRESLSADYMEREFGIKPRVVPDLMFSNYISKPTPTLELAITDAANLWPDEALIVRNLDFLDELGKYKRWVAGRFHCIALGIMWRVPFSAYASNTWKNKGMMKDAGLLDFYAETYEEALHVVPNKAFGRKKRIRIEIDGKKRRSKTEYVRNAKKKIDRMFDRICK